MKRNLFIIKIGGSVITDKSKARSAFRQKIVRRIVKEIVQAKKTKNFDLILVHGAGAYPHYLTTKYRISEGFKGTKSAFGFAHIKQELFKLNNLFWSECLKAGLAVSTVQPSAVIFTKNGKIKSFDTGFIEALLKIGITPVLMGDDSIDETRGISVLSGDKIVAYLGKKFKAKKIIFVSDVEGVYDKNPKVYKDAKLITEIGKKNFRSIIQSMQRYNINDASGEMKGKLLAISENLTGFEVQIVGGFKIGAVRFSLEQSQGGTRIAL